MGSVPYMHLDYNQLKEPMMMMTKATIFPTADVLSQISGSHRYSNGTVDITISQSGIVLSRVGEDVTERAVPEGLMPWLKPQILLNGIVGMSGSKLRKLSEHQSWWQDIENGLFEPKIALTRNENIRERPKRKAETGDEVYIVIDSVDDYFHKQSYIQLPHRRHRIS